MANAAQKTISKTDDMMDDAMNAAQTSEAPAAVREFAEKSVKQAKDGYAKFKSAAEETSDALEDAYATSSKGYKELGRKSVEVSRSNLNAHFDFLHALLGAKSVTQAVELQSSYARQQFEALGGQVKELSTIAQKAMTDGSKPFQDLATKGLRSAQR